MPPTVHLASFATNAVPDPAGLPPPRLASFAPKIGRRPNALAPSAPAADWVRSRRSREPILQRKSRLRRPLSYEREIGFVRPSSSLLPREKVTKGRMRARSLRAAPRDRRPRNWLRSLTFRPVAGLDPGAAAPRNWLRSLTFRDVRRPSPRPPRRHTPRNPRIPAHPAKPDHRFIQITKDPTSRVVHYKCGSRRPLSNGIPPNRARNLECGRADRRRAAGVEGCKGAGRACIGRLNPGSPISRLAGWAEGKEPIGRSAFPGQAGGEVSFTRRSIDGANGIRPAASCSRSGRRRPGRTSRDWPVRG
jgi:hypothetical protein